MLLLQLTDPQTFQINTENPALWCPLVHIWIVTLQIVFLATLLIRQGHHVLLRLSSLSPMVTALNFQAESHLSTNQAQLGNLFGNQSKAQPENSDSQQLQE